MTKEKLTQKILQYAVDSAKTNTPAPVDYNTTNAYGNPVLD